jgi:hypothetical protein
MLVLSNAFSSNNDPSGQGAQNDWAPSAQYFTLLVSPERTKTKSTSDSW